MSGEIQETAAIDVSVLILMGHHHVLRIGVHKDLLAPYFLGSSTETHSNGAPLAYDVEIDHIRFTAGLDELGRLSHWTIKKSLQDRSFLFTAATKEIRLWDIDAFGFLCVLEDLRIAYTREVWGKAVCVVTIQQSGVSLSFDLEPSLARGAAAIQLSTTPLYLGGDVFQKSTYD